MKRILILLAIPAALLCAADKKADPPNVPKGAVQVDNYTYRYTDAKGGKWLYRQTPFGFVKMEDKPAAPVAESPDANPTTVTDLGESVKFERKTPFGAQSWTKKKADLTDDEKALVSKSGAEKR